MAVKGPTSPLSSGAESLEPLDSKELQQTAKTEQIAVALAALESATSNSAGEAAPAQSAALKGLQEIAANANFSTQEKTEAAIRESARFMIKSRIQEKFREQEKFTEMYEELSDVVVKDPFLKKKLKDILERLKEK